MKLFWNLIPLLIIVFLGVLLTRPLQQSGFYPMHDDTQVARVHQMAKALADGMFPVRWVPDLGYGYGYPIFNFYAPLAYYLGGFLVLIGLDALVATKIMIGIPISLVGLGMYFLSKEFWGRAGGLISAILAMCAPYVALDIFVRGAIAESYAYSFLPLVFYSLIQIYKTGKFRYMLIGSVSLSAVILSHNLTTLMLLPFLFLFLFVVGYLLVRKKLFTKFWMIVLSLLLAIFLSGFYWLPALFEMNYTNVSSQIGGGADFRDHFVCLEQLWESQWGYGGSVPGCMDGLSFRLGKLHIVLTLLCVPLLLVLKEKKYRILLLFGYVFIMLSLFLLLPQSLGIWEFIKPMAFIQYPWRFLGLLSLSTAYISGAVVLYSRFLPVATAKIARFGLAFLVTVGCFVLYSKLFEPQTILSASWKDYTRIDILHSKISRISDEYLPTDFKKPDKTVPNPTGRIGKVNGLTAEMIYDGTGYKLIRTSSDEGGTLYLNLAYFPAWHFLLDSKPLDSHVSEGRYYFDIPKGEHLLKAVFRQTTVEILGNLLSLIGFLGALAGIIYARKHRVL